MPPTIAYTPCQKGGGNLIYLGGNQFTHTGPIREFGQVQQSLPPPVDLHATQFDYAKCHQASASRHSEYLHPARGDTNTEFIIMKSDPYPELNSTAGSSPHFRDEQTPHKERRHSWSIVDRTAHKVEPVSKFTLLISHEDFRLLKLVQGALCGPTGTGRIVIPESASGSSRKRHSPQLDNSAEGSKESTYVPTERGPGSNYANEYLRHRLNLPSSSRPVSLASIPADTAPSTPLKLLAMTAIHDARKPLTSREICARLNEAFPGLGLGEVSYQVSSFRALPNVLCDFPG